MLLPEEVATATRTAISPSKKYILSVRIIKESEITFQSFEILDKNGKFVYTPSEKFDNRHTTFFVWGEHDRVWVYSGDVGTFFWQVNPNTNNWKKYVYVRSSIAAPKFLKEIRPKWHQR